MVVMRHRVAYDTAIRFIAANRTDPRSGALPLGKAAPTMLLSADSNQALKVRIKTKIP